MTSNIKTSSRDPLFLLPKDPLLAFKECLTSARLFFAVGFVTIVCVYLVDVNLWKSGLAFNPAGSVVIMALGGLLILVGFIFLTYATFPRYLKVPEALLSIQKSLLMPFWLTVWTIVWGILLHFASQYVTNPLNPPWLLLQVLWAIPMFLAIYLTHIALTCEE